MSINVSKKTKFFIFGMVCGTLTLGAQLNSLANGWRYSSPQLSTKGEIPSSARNEENEFKTFRINADPIDKIKKAKSQIEGCALAFREKLDAVYSWEYREEEYPQGPTKNDLLIVTYEVPKEYEKTKKAFDRWIVELAAGPLNVTLAYNSWLEQNRNVAIDATQKVDSFIRYIRSIIFPNARSEGRNHVGDLAALFNFFPMGREYWDGYREASNEGKDFLKNELLKLKLPLYENVSVEFGEGCR